MRRRKLIGLIWASVVLCGLALGQNVSAAPYAAMVMDARNGEVLHARNADTKLHPASLTKMMTLYITFEAVARGELSMDTQVRISRNAAAEPPSKLGLKAGQTIALRYLVRAAALKSANDASTAIGEAISGSEEAFARRMTRTARALGMSNTTFKNAHGLTQQGHQSTARDMTKLGRRLLFDYPEYYNLFSRQSTNVAGREVRNTNRRLLSSYRGADGIKTGYTQAAGFNLVASAERGNKRVIATVFGGRSSATRNARVAELLDMGFERAPSNVRVRAPSPASAPEGREAQATQQVAQASTLVSKSPRPRARPDQGRPNIDAVVAEVLSDNPPSSQSVTAAPPPPPRPVATVSAAPSPADTGPQLEVITRSLNPSGRRWSIQVGQFNNRNLAERFLLRTALIENRTLAQADRQIISRGGKYEARFIGLSQGTANLACQRLNARNLPCTARASG